jgi:hypothetical protein
LLVEHDCEPTQSLCPWDHVVKNATSYLTKTLSWQPPISKDLTSSKTKSQDLFERKVFKTNYFIKSIGI